MPKSKTYPNMQHLVLSESNEFLWIDCEGSITFTMNDESSKVTSIENQAIKKNSTLDFPTMFRTMPTKDMVPNAENTFWLFIIDNYLYRANYNVFTNGAEKARQVDSKSAYINVTNILIKLFPTWEKSQQDKLVKFEVGAQGAAPDNIEKIIQSSPNSITALLHENDQSENSNDDGYRSADKSFVDRLIDPDTEDSHSYFSEDQIQLALAIALSLKDKQQNNVSTDKYSLKSMIDNYLHLTLTNKSISAAILIGVATSLAVFLLICAISNPVALVTASIAGVTSGIATGTACFFGFKRSKLPEYDAANHQSNLNHCVL